MVWELCTVDAYLPLATSQSNVHETAGICDSLLRATLGGLLLLLGLNLESKSVSAALLLMLLFPSIRCHEGRTARLSRFTAASSHPPSLQIRNYRTFGV